eukprot:CAMPEP_0194282752 /NCGR_PEP_ID=MMETSP0169-20130528/23797_1 /TAXON_ID=218684 /ORGANISM="Corethron pennatum, Strain L29A3" /LENGTH=42 /DNA_ID= /DNA_START= /DNA_END= /DNA_ORIENTATION=
MEVGNLRKGRRGSDIGNGKRGGGSTARLGLWREGPALFGERG